MTLTILPFPIDDDYFRTTPRVANLEARGGFRDAHWRKVRRRLDPCDVTPLPEERKPSLIYRLGCWYMARRWPAIALLVLGCAFFGSAIVAATYGWRVQ